MADNVQINAMDGGDVIAADDIAGIKYQRVKIGYGADGTFNDIHPGAPLPALVLSGTSVDSAQVTVATAGTAVQLPAHPQIYGLSIRANNSNTGDVYIGGPTVTAGTGFELGPGEGISLDVTDTAAVHIDADTDGDGVSLLWVNT